MAADAEMHPGRAIGLPPSVLLGAGWSLDTLGSSASGFKAYLMWFRIRLDQMAWNLGAQLIGDFLELHP